MDYGWICDIDITCTSNWRRHRASVNIYRGWMKVDGLWQSVEQGH